MTKYTTAQLIAGLRCVNDPYHLSEPICEECPFAEKERFNDNNWISCDPDNIGLAAADRLEELERVPHEQNLCNRSR